MEQWYGWLGLLRLVVALVGAASRVCLGATGQGVMMSGDKVDDRGTEIFFASSNHELGVLF